MFSPSASPPSLSSSHGFVLVAFVVVSSGDVFEAAVEGVLVERLFVALNEIDECLDSSLRIFLGD